MNNEPFAKLETALYEEPAPKDGSISTKSMAKAIDEGISSHYSAPPRVGSVSSFAKGFNFYILLTLAPTCLFGIGFPSLPIQQVEAEHIDYDEKLLVLTGNVSVAHEIGTLHCNKAVLQLNESKKSETDSAFNKIFLHESVVIDFTDGSKLISDEGEIDCVSMEGVFTAQAPSKVIYTSFAQNGRQKNPVQAAGRTLRAKIIKTDQGYALSTLKGEGAVHIKYLSPIATPNEKQEASE